MRPSHEPTNFPHQSNICGGGRYSSWAKRRLHVNRLHVYGQEVLPPEQVADTPYRYGQEHATVLGSMHTPAHQTTCRKSSPLNRLSMVSSSLMRRAAASSTSGRDTCDQYNHKWDGNCSAYVRNETYATVKIIQCYLRRLHLQARPPATSSWQGWRNPRPREQFQSQLEGFAVTRDCRK